MDILYGNPLDGVLLTQYRDFLQTLGLRYDEAVECSILLVEEGEILAGGSRDGNVLKCIGVSRAHQNGGLAARLLSLLSQEAANAGITHLFLYTKKDNTLLFSQLGFRCIAATPQIVLMENRKHGLEDFLRAIPLFPEGRIGCIAANCDPMTMGHEYLMKKAALECDGVYVFVLAGGNGLFSADERLKMVRETMAPFRNIHVLSGGRYVISPETFPDYYIRDKKAAEEMNCLLDLEIFSRSIAPALNISVRYVGTEPLSPGTAYYNESMHRLLPQRGIAVKEISRLCRGGTPVSAGEVRRMLKAGKLSAAEMLVPETVKPYLREVTSCGLDA